MSQEKLGTAEPACDNSRRDFIKKAGYAAPAILTLQAHSALASSGSVKTDPGPIDRKKAREKARCEANNRVRARKGLPPKPC